MGDVKCIGVLCSGGDSPGMNSAIRAVVRTAIGMGLKVIGIQKGYSGMFNQVDYHPMDVSSVGNILQHGGTILQTSRCERFMTPEGRKDAAELLRKNGINALIVIGGDGSFKGAMKLHQEHGIIVVGIPGTIDNDIDGTEYTIGFDTAIRNAADAVDKLRDTANSHGRTFIVEVMGARSPAIALKVGICTGAENVVIPTENIDYEKIVADIQRGVKRGKMSSIIIIAEGKKEGIGYVVRNNLKERYNVDSHVCILGHVQRGGKPTPMDRLIAAQMGRAAVQAILAGDSAVAAVFLQGKVQIAPLKNCLRKKNEHDLEDVQLIKALSI